MSLVTEAAAVSQGLRVPPHSHEAETAVLGSLLLENDAWTRVEDALVAGDFYRLENQLVFAVVSSMLNTGKQADVITVFEQLDQLGQADAVGGLPYLNALAQYVSSAANVRRYAEIIRERSILRKLISVGGSIAESAFEAKGADVSQLLDSAEQKVMRIGESHSKSQAGPQTIESIVVRALDRIAELADNPDAHTGLMSGFIDLDRLTSGFQAGDLVILAARPSMGKTAMAINMAEHVAINTGLPVAIFSMEMSADQLGVRLLGSLGRIDQTHLRVGALTEAEWPRLAEAVERLRNTKIDVEDSPGLSVHELRASARRLHRKHGKLGLIVVDYLQLMTVSSSMAKENRATAVGELSRGLKSLAQELGCPVLALSQLSRGVESRTDKRPMMSDLRESGAIEQDADTIMFIYRDDYYTKEACKEPGVAELIISKQRSGPTGTVRLAWVAALTKFDNLAHSPRY